MKLNINFGNGRLHLEGDEEGLDQLEDLIKMVNESGMTTGQRFTFLNEGGDWEEEGHYEIVITKDKG